jgi:hypothetical protein
MGSAVQEADQDRAEATEQLEIYELGQLQKIKGAQRCFHLIMTATIYNRKLKKITEIQTIGIV